MTTTSTLTDPTISTPYTRVSVMVSQESSNSISRHGDPAENAITCAGMIYRKSSNRSSRHGYLVDNKSGNMSRRQYEPTYIANNSGAGKLKTIYFGKNQYPISIVQLNEVSDIA